MTSQELNRRILDLGKGVWLTPGPLAAELASLLLALRDVQMQQAEQINALNRALAGKGGR